MALQHVEDEAGMARWEEPNQSAIEFRAPDGTKVKFQAYRRSSLLVRTKIGAEVATTGRNFVRARIDSRYYVQAQAQVYQAYMDSDSDSNGSYLDEYEQKIIMGSLPIRVESLCRVQWHDVRLDGIVRYGQEVFTLDPVPDFPFGWPEDWPPLPVDPTISVTPRTLDMQSRRVGVTTRGSVYVQATGSPQDITVSQAPSPSFEVVNTGRVRVQPGASSRHVVNVTFTPTGPNPVTGSFQIDTPDGPRTVRLTGRVTGQPEMARP